MTTQILTAERLRELLHYDPEKGVFTWLVRPGYRVHVGDVAGNMQTNGYWYIQIDRKLHRAHRLAWLWLHGNWPTNQIDHINGIRDDNRICNLRDVTRSENMQNLRSARSDSKSGLAGVGWYSPKRRWTAKIMIDGKRHDLGRFITADFAHEAYCAAKARLHPFGNLRKATP